MANNNNNKVLNVPNLRFPEFKEEWERTSLDEVTTFVKERIGADKLTRNNYVSTENMNPDFGGINQASSVPNNTNVIHYQKGDVLLSNIRPYLRKVWAASSDGGCSADVFVFRAKSISSSFLHYIMANDTFINYVMSGAKGVKMPRGDKEQILKYIFSTPNIEEQNKISHLLQLLDNRIATQNKIIEDLKKLKSAIIDTKILRNQTAVTIRLSEVCKEAEQIKESTPSFDRIITVRLHANGVHQSNADNLELGATQYYIRKSGQLIYGKQNFHNGAIGIIPESLDGGLTSKDIPSFDIFQDKVNPIYLVCYMQHPSFYEPIEALTTGSGSKRLKERDFLNLQIHLPNKEVQDEIAHSLTVLVSKIDLESRILDLYTKQRSYLLSQMFI